MSFEIIYHANTMPPHWLYRKEAPYMRRAGLTVRITPSNRATKLLIRSLIMNEGDYPKDPRYVQNGTIYTNLTRIDRWYSLIKDLTIETVFCENLEHQAEECIQKKGWSRCFVKNSIKSLVAEDPLESCWPNCTFKKLAVEFEKLQTNGPFALRAYLPPDRFKNENRYWVIGDQIHHSSGVIPEIVREAKNRLDVFDGVFYTIDATPDLIVEINGGESSDRKTDNNAEDFAKWIKSAFQS